MRSSPRCWAIAMDFATKVFTFSQTLKALLRLVEKMTRFFGPVLPSSAAKYSVFSFLSLKSRWNGSHFFLQRRSRQVVKSAFFIENDNKEIGLLSARAGRT